MNPSTILFTSPVQPIHEIRVLEQEPAPQTVISNQRKYEWFKPLPYYVSGALAIAFTIASIANLFLLQFSRALFFACSALTSFLLTRTLSSYPPLAESVQEMGALTRFLHERISLLQRETLVLEQNKKELEKIVRAESISQRELAQSIKEHGAQFDTVHLQIGNMKASLEKSLELKTKWDEISAKIEKEVCAFRETAQTFTTHDQKVTSLIASLNDISKKTAFSISEGQALATKLGETREAWATQFQKMSTEMAELQTDFAAKSTSVDALIETTKELKESNQRYDSLVQKFQATKSSIDEILTNYEKIQANYARVDEKIQKLLQAPTLEGAKLLANEARVLLTRLQ